MTIIIKTNIPPKNNKTVYKLKTIIKGGTPFNHINTDYNKVATKFLDLVECKNSAYYNKENTRREEGAVTLNHREEQLLTIIVLNYEYNKENISKTNKNNTINNTYSYYYCILIQMIYEFQTKLINDVKDQRKLILINIVIPINKNLPKEEYNMITKSRFYDNVKNVITKTLDVRYPKSHIKPTGLIILPALGNYRKWYYGIEYNTNNEKKVNLIPYLSGESVSSDKIKLIEIKEKTYNDNEIKTLNSIGQLWNIDEFNYARQPIDIGNINNSFAFQHPTANIDNCPIKLAGDDKLYIPVEYESIIEVINKVISYEKEINPNYIDYYAYLTVNKNYVKSGSTQNRELYHVDRFPNQINTTVQHNYAVTDVVPNVHIINPLNISSSNQTIYDIYKDFTRQSQHIKKIYTKPFHIYLYDGYQVHAPTKAQMTTDKTFVRLSFSKQKLNMLGYGINPLIPNKWDYVPNNLEEMSYKKLISYNKL